MALIGTISGSNGTSTTAISGSLVIADAPASSFPRLTGGVKFLVSGSKNADRTDNAQFLFDVDVFHSGAIGSNQFMQFKPVGALQIPTNTTASYIYTSGSTNDLYFTQYQPGTGFTNTTRLRWLESVLGTGLLRGGTLSTENGSTTFSIVSGSGIIITQNASLGVDPFPTIANITWASVVSQSLTYVASNQITYISVDSLGTVNQSPNPPTIAEKASNIYLGRILHQAGSVTNGSISEPAISYGLGESTFNFQRAFGPLKISGHFLTATASNGGTRTLGLNKTAGDTYAEGRNYTLNPNSPNLVLSANDPALTTSKIFREYTNSSGDPVILNNGGAGYEEIAPSQYNNGGTLDSVGASEWTNQRVFWFPRSVNRALFVYYGPEKYGNFDDAIAGISTETFTEGANTVGSAIFVGVITVKGNGTDLTATNARITQAALHRGAGIGGGGGGGSTSPGGSNTYVQFNDASGFSGTNDFRFLKSTGTVLAANLVVTGSGEGSLVSSGTMQVKNSLGAVVGSMSSLGVISGSSDLQIGGNITGSSAFLRSDLAVNGGNITTTAGTFSIANATATTVNLGGGASAINIGSSSGRTTVVNDLAVGTGTIIGAPGSGANVMTLISSGNLIAKIDTDGGAEGHRFAIQDYRNIDQFSVGENGNAELSGSLVVTGSLAVNGGSITSTAATVNIANTTPTTVTIGNNATNLYLGKSGTNRVHINGNLLLVNNEIQPSGGATGLTFPSGNPSAQFAANLTVVGDLAVNGGDLTSTQTTFNLLNSTVTTLNVGGAAASVLIGGTTTTSSFTGAAQIDGRSTLSSITEKMVPSVGGTGTVSYDLSLASIFYANNPTGDITANFIGVPTTNNRILTPTVILSQSATPPARIISAVQIDNAAQTINWANGVTPTGTAGKQDVFGFSLIRSGSAWKVLGQMSTYG